MTTMKIETTNIRSDLAVKRAERRDIRKLKKHNAREAERAAIAAGVKAEVMLALAGQKATISPTNDLEPGVVMMVRSQPRKLAPGLDNRFVAVNRRDYIDCPDLRTGSLAKLWNARLSAIARAPADFLKSGLATWKQVGINLSSAKTAAFFRIHEDKMDQPTSDAAQAALMLVYNTASGPGELEAAAVALGAFLHADPLRADPEENRETLLPYGTETAYKALHPHPFAKTE